MKSLEVAIKMENTEREKDDDENAEAEKNWVKYMDKPNAQRN